MDMLKILVGGMAVLIAAREAMKRKQGPQTCSELDIGCDCIIGKREIQEDSTGIAFSDDATMAVMADGRGKNRAGKISSLMSTEIFCKIFKREPCIHNVDYFYMRAFNVANREILKMIGDEAGGASIVSAVVKNGMLHHAQVGNAMIGVFRNDELVRLGEGHTLADMAKRGYHQGKLTKEEALGAIREKRLMNYVGQDGFKGVEIHEAPVRLKDGDIILLASDGIHEAMPWNRIENILKKRTGAQNMARMIIDDIDRTEIENKDNASIIVMKYKANKLRM